MPRNTQGANYLYMKFILPTLKQHETVIDQYVEIGETNFRSSLAQLVRLRSQRLVAASRTLLRRHDLQAVKPALIRGSHTYALALRKVC